jgi:predicted phage terminase large subunit-like protein
VNAALIRDTKQEDIDFDRAYVKAFGLYGFLKVAWHLLEPGTPFVDGPHIEQICNHLEAVSHGLIKRLIINVPPGSSKSVCTAVAWPAWDWGPNKKATRKWLYTSFDPGLSSRDSLKALELINSEWYQDRWPVDILDRAKTDYRTSKRGFRRSVGTKGKITGRHPDIQVVDDPMKASDSQGNAAIKKTELVNVQNWWTGTMASRGADPKKVARVIIMQRLHDDDLAGFVLEQAKHGGEAYVHLRLPMEYEAAYPCITYMDPQPSNDNGGAHGPRLGGDWRTQEGELLCPERWDRAVVEQKKRELNTEYSAQYQQRPSNIAGQIFKKAWLKFWDYDTLRALGCDPRTGKGFDEVACSWDFTFKDTQGSDFVCGQVWGRLGPNYYLLERVYKRMNFPNSLTSIEAMLRRWPLIGPKVVEDKANGPAIISTLERKVSGLIAVSPEGSKVTRANAVSYLHRAGNVWYMPEMEGELGDEAHVQCITKFPLAKYDDSVDAETQMLLYWESNKNALFAALEALAKEQAAQAAALARAG